MFVGIYLLNDIIEDANHHTMPRQITADQRAQVTMVTYNVIDPGFTVYGCLHLHRQTGRTQNSGLVNFVPEPRLPFVKISSIYRKTTAKAWNWYQRWLWRVEHEFPLGIVCRPENRTALFRCSVAPGNFRWNDPKRRAPFTFQPDFLETFVNGRLFTSSDFTWLSTSKSGKSRIKNSSLVSPKHLKVLPLENVQCSVV